MSNYITPYPRFTHIQQLDPTNPITSYQLFYSNKAVEEVKRHWFLDMPETKH